MTESCSCLLCRPEQNEIEINETEQEREENEMKRQGRITSDAFPHDPVPLLRYLEKSTPGPLQMTQIN